VRGVSREVGVVVGIVLTAVMLLALLAPVAVAKGTAGLPEERLEIYVAKPGHPHRNPLSIRIYAAQGVATASSVSDFESALGGTGSGVTYAIRIPRRSLDGRIDIHFPGLGRVVGHLREIGKAEPKKTQRACVELLRESAAFVGRIDFRGSGGYATWGTGRAPASLERPAPGCASSARPSKPKKLGEYVSELGPYFVGGGGGPVSELRAVLGGRGGATGFYAQVYGRGPGETVDFTVLDYERLAGEVLCNRWVALRGVPRGDLFEIAPGARSPSSATVSPPGPFSGEATYSRKGRTFLGDLIVHLPGRTIHLAGTTAEASVENAT
jgi:hypothetical protein